MTSDAARARASVVVLAVGTVVGVLAAVGPLLVVREVVEARGGDVDGSAVVGAAVVGGAAALATALPGWHRALVGSGGWGDHGRSRQVAAAAALALVVPLALCAAWARQAVRVASDERAAAVAAVLPDALGPVLPGLLLALAGSIGSAAVVRRLPVVVGAVTAAAGLVLATAAEPSWLGWTTLAACLVATSLLLRPRRPLGDARR